MKHIYFIGGSPCCGKSTMAERISKNYRFHYYKADDSLAQYIQRGASDGDEWLQYIASMSMDELWLRNPEVLCDEELHTYERLFPYFIADLEKLGGNTPIITEGAAFLPFLAAKLQIDKTHYVCVVPSREFQIKHFKKRLWVNNYLALCSNTEEAFTNWMERDVLFALAALEQARERGFTSLIVDGSKNIDENLSFVEQCFCL